MNDSAQALSASQFFQENGFLVMKSFLSEPMLSVTYNYAMRKVAVGEIEFSDRQVPNTPCAYGGAFMETFLEMTCSSIEQATNLQLFPTYSYYRVYKNGDSLAPHRDRPSCEISVTLTLGYESDVKWPINFERSDGSVKIEMEPGDAIVYRGCDIKHWRERFYGVHHAQVFLHYVDQAGQYAAYKYDKRPMLGAPRVGRDTTGQLSEVDSLNRDHGKDDFSSDVKVIPQNEFIGMPCSAESCFTVDECKDIVRLGEEQEGQSASVSDTGISEGSTVVEKLRKSRVAWLNREPRTKWIFDRIDAVVKEVNGAYKFDLSGYNLIQIARYSEGNYYDWHLDIGKKLSSTRKLSITVQLSDPADYDGGELELFSFTRENPTRNIGSIIVFPSFLTHRIAPVTRGVRWSLVAWVNGPPIR